MQHHEFIAHVRKRADLDSAEAAETATRATLETIAERMAGGEPKDIAAQLPEPLQKYLLWEGAEEGKNFSADVFYQKVAERAGSIDVATAQQQAKAVVAVLQEAISPGLLGHMRIHFPAEYDPLFG